MAANTAQIGLFTATAELLVDFSTDTTAGTVDGVVRDFMENGESLGNWRIDLGDASLAAIGGQDAETTPGMAEDGRSTTQFAGPVSARIGASGANGDWVGTFHGNDRADDKPEAIAGMFEVSAAHAAIAGAFAVYNTAAE